MNHETCTRVARTLIRNSDGIILIVYLLRVIIEMSKPKDNSEPIEGTKMIFRLKEMRTMRDLTQYELALKIKMSPTNVQRYEQGKVKSIPFETLESFCDALDCEPGDLIVRVKNGG